MNKNDCVIRLEKEEDYASTENLVREAFWNVYRPGCCEHYVLHELRSYPDFVRELDLVMTESGRLIGQTVSVKAVIHSDDGKERTDRTDPTPDRLEDGARLLYSGGDHRLFIYAT